MGGSANAYYSAVGPYAELGVRDHELGVTLDYRRLSGTDVVSHRFGLTARYYFASAFADRYDVARYEMLQAFVEGGVALDAIVADTGGQRTGGDAMIGVGALDKLLRTANG